MAIIFNIVDVLFQVSFSKKLVFFFLAFYNSWYVFRLFQKTFFNSFALYSPYVSLYNTQNDASEQTSYCANFIKQDVL